MRSGNYLRLAAATAGGFLALLMAAPAQAQATVDINAEHVPTTAEEFPTQECTGPFEDLAEDEDGWHFQLGGGGDSFTSVTLTFDTPDGEVPVVITSRDPDAPSTGPGWSGYIAEAGGSGQFSHVWLVTDAGWTLTDGTATVENAGTQDSFNLSHTCPGTPVEPTPSPTETPGPTPTATAVPSPTVSPTVPAGPQLPTTGFPVTGLVAIGAGLVAAGLGVLVSRRQRAEA